MGELFTENENFYECQECPEGRYSIVEPKMNANQTCQVCPMDMAISCKGGDINLKSGYWRENATSEVIFF